MKNPVLVALAVLSVSVPNANALEKHSVTVQGRLTCCIPRGIEQGRRESLQQQAGPQGPPFEAHHPLQESVQHRHKRDGGSHGEVNRADGEWRPEKGDQGGLANYGIPGWVAPPGSKPVSGSDGRMDRGWPQESREVSDEHAWGEGPWEDRTSERRREEQDLRRPPEASWGHVEDRSGRQEQWDVEDNNGWFGQQTQTQQWAGDGSRGQKVPDSQQWQEQDPSPFDGRRKHEFGSLEREESSRSLPLHWRHKRAPSSRAQCFEEPQQNVLIQLYTDDMSHHNLPAETRTDRTGHFKLTGNGTQASIIEPYLIIKHHCSDAAAEELKQGCSFVTRVDIPKEHINGNPFEINSLEVLAKSGHSMSTKQQCP